MIVFLQNWLMYMLRFISLPALWLGMPCFTQKPNSEQITSKNQLPISSNYVCMANMHPSIDTADLPMGVLELYFHVYPILIDLDIFIICSI